MNKKMAERFHALGDPNRLIIIDALAKGETCGCTIINNLSISQPTLSYHLKIMTDSSILNAYKEGTWKKHKINHKEIKEMIDYLNSLLQKEKTCDSVCDNI
ncbi:metalloregulator ArsR/SmtB family transcription factor [Trichlorobacter sp.]|jgi:ArsR family transcriptional regulator|uniref:ArsR/SmtB family transcription factor n=1 Tax=Trichlorobacter sp. TaxID=2911007 RepID=UPI002A1713C0|nr:metalloregulator ArsR/SmtB family transcription factor [Trichlorobacter sp.]MDD2398950.1 metalloregulator ArsR/SmtB family transcription factor [Bacilli bacterium]MDD3389654.1 metalloregulator ArsR/SmtB family transcription factor [Bacilli bacterium]MDD4345264.1 metalloregulator ArsR/SmtB family transcription factor [Bacilli bacterium]MDD4521297.1 metalloregulator ArsR/SmtB family transcription factor [Bacilli bacterium]MDY0385419.1 metalloregulator ArsR/SmtB family transcription factor [Tr